MTKKELVKIIQEAVRREVKKEVEKIFIKEESSPTLESMISKPEVSEPKKQIKYTKNETLNKVLNETRGGLPQQGKEEYRGRMAPMAGWSILVKRRHFPRQRLFFNGKPSGHRKPECFTGRRLEQRFHV